MESFDPPMNNANSGKSRRRISSILKAPRTSVHSADPEHVETPVQVAMPVEKRNSRRVSFAPATDVLLFSKEKRNCSPVRSPLQDQSAPNIPDNRNPIGVIAKGIHPITDMETLLNAPLQNSHQTKEVLMASHDAEELSGEKTTMYSAMDLTHSHTMVIDSDLPDQHGETLSSSANMDFFFSTDRRKAEPCSLPKTSSSVQHFDPEFEKLLASMSKPTVPRDNSMLRKVQPNALMMPHDKENRAPTLRTTKGENLPHNNEQNGKSSNKGVVPSADDPFQGLFPTLDLYRRTEQREPIERNGRQQFFEAPECALSKPNVEATPKISVVDSKSLRLGVPTLKLGNSLTQTCPENRLIPPTKNVRHVLHLEEYANRNSSESDDMDMTRSQTVAIDSRSVHTLTKQPEISAISAGFEHDMDFTRSQTGIIEAKNLDLGMLSYTANAGKMADNQWDRPLNQAKITMGNFEIDNMEITQSQTTAIDSLHGGKQFQISENIVKPTAKCNYLSEDDAMELTTWGHVSTLDLKKSLPVEDNKINWKLSQTEKSDFHDMESDDMEITRSQTVAIDAKNLNVAISTSQDKKHASMEFMSAFTKACTQNTSQKEFDRDMTKKQSNKSLIFDDNINGEASQRDGFESYNFESDDMEMTKSQTVAIDAKTLNVVNPSDYKKRKSLAFPTVTSKSQASGLSMPGKSLGSFFSKMEPAMDTDMDLTRSQTRRIEVKELSSGMESQNPDDLDIACNQPIIQSHGPGDASLHLSGSAGHLGVDLKSRSHVLMALGGRELTKNGTCIQLNQEATMFDQLDASQNEVNSSPRCVDKNSTMNAEASMLNKNGSEFTQENHRNSSCGSESPAVAGVDETSSTKTRRMSLVDLQSKLRRMSHLPNEPTEKFAVDNVYAPLSESKPASERIADHTQLLTAPQHNPDTQGADNANYTQPEQSEEHQPCVTAPLNVNRKGLTSRLSLGNFLPKLPQKIKAADPDKVSGGGRWSVEEHDDKVIPHLLLSGVIDDIADEVLPNISSDEDLSMDTEGSQCANQDGRPLYEHDVQEASEEEVWERSPGQPSDPQGKRPSPVQGEDTMATEKRRRVSLTDASEMQNPSPEEGKCIGTPPSAPAFMTEAIDMSNCSRTAHLRSETTFESTLKQSIIESQLEDNKDYTNDFPKNIVDERITVKEFFKLLNIDFVIHNPRQSIVPGKQLASHLGHTPEALLKSRHISLPSQRVYELDHQNLAEQVERLKARMMDQDRPLRSINKPLWEELKCFSQDELKRFGCKMKERSNFFRKQSKAQSHEMKETLYSNLLQANQEERQKLRGKMKEADGMLKGLDDCIQELEAELASVEGSGLDDGRPTLKSSQRELENVTMELADRERHISELEMQKRCNMEQVTKLQTEVQDLNRHVTMLHMVNEWRVASRSADLHVYSFLYGSFGLEVVFETCAGGEPAGDRERNVLAVHFKLELDVDKSACHARLVHSLLSDFTKGRSDWAEKYPTDRCVPKLLHDVGLVVSRCRLLGEEVRVLKAWGGLRLDVLDISCEDASVRVVFSSLEAMAEFELTLGVSVSYPSCPLQLQDFKNHIGSMTAQRIEEIVSSVSPGKGYLTRIVKAIHAAVLS